MNLSPKNMMYMLLNKYGKPQEIVFLGTSPLLHPPPLSLGAAELFLRLSLQEKQCL